MPVPDGSLTVEQFKDQVDGLGTLEDETIEALLTDVWNELIALYGPVGTITERHAGGTSVVILTRPAESITSIKEIDVNGVETTLAVDDWSIRFDNRSLRRLSSGTNYSLAFGDRGSEVVVVYEAADDAAARRNAQRELVKLEIISRPGLAMLVVGNFSVQFQQGRTYAELRADILGSFAGPDYGFA